MHIPDGFLSTPVCAGMAVMAGPCVVFAARKARETLDERRVPLLGVMGAFIFAAQMINFPVGLGTSGHLLGGALLAMTIGPAAAIVVMTAIVAVQALVFQDGGLLALGANVFNMAVVGVAAGYAPFRWLGASNATRWRTAAIFLGGFLSVVVCAGLALTELWTSGVMMPRSLVLVSLALFAVAAAAEGVITVLAVRAIEAINPEWVRKPEESNRRLVLAVSVGALVLISLAVFLASSAPDGLQSLALQAGFASREHGLVTTPFSGYQTDWLSGASSFGLWTRQASAGVVGLCLVFVVSVAAARMLKRRT